MKCPSGQRCNHHCDWEDFCYLEARQPNPTPPAAPTLEQLEAAVREAHNTFQRAMQSGKDYQREANAFNDACQRLANQTTQLSRMGIGQL